MGTGGPCLTDKEVSALVQGSLAPSPAERAGAHLGACSQCRKWVAEVARARGVEEETLLELSKMRVPEQATLKSGDRVGRYLIEAPVASGGMGVVYRARDSELDRLVAIKVLHAGASGNEPARARLLREAQAMARLSHPNVVTVHELGIHGDHVFLAMEYVAGQTLRRWLASQPRTPEAIVRAFIEAGRGLLAAHQAGLIHRDFKPDNVLVGEDGRIRVTDFGLAQPAGETPASEPVDLMDEAAATDWQACIRTKTGLICGTPAYMAPEQVLSGEVDPRTDQFSFCVSLYESLFKSRPFQGRSMAELLNAISSTEVRVPSTPAVPRGVRLALLRGLQREPQARFHSLNELLKTLAAAPRRRWWTAAALGGCAAVAALALVLFTGDLSRPPEPAPAAAVVVPADSTAAAPGALVGVDDDPGSVEAPAPTEPTPASRPVRPAKKPRPQARSTRAAAQAAHVDDDSPPASNKAGRAEDKDTMLEPSFLHDRK